MIDSETLDVLDSQPTKRRTKKRKGSGDAQKRYVRAVSDCERDYARRVKRQERGSWR